MLPRRTVLAAVTSAAVVAVGVVVYATTRDDATPHPRAALPVAAPVPATHAATPTPSPRPKPRVRHDRVAASVPTSFRISGPAFTINAAVCQMANVRPLDPPGDQLHTVCWVKSGFGVAPGSPSGGTSYILGHAWAEQKLVFNPLSEYAMNHLGPRHPVRGGVVVNTVNGLTGYRVTLHTGTGVLTYTVRSAFTVAKEQAAYVTSLMAEKTPNRVVLITCGVKDGVDVDVNVIVYANLTSSKRLPA